jgi:hypothetical protein
METGSCDYRDSHIVSNGHVGLTMGYSTHIYELDWHHLHQFGHTVGFLCDMRYLHRADSTYAETESGWTCYCQYASIHCYYHL